jgi:hypothetical protein
MRQAILRKVAASLGAAGLASLMVVSPGVVRLWPFLVFPSSIQISPPVNSRCPVRVAAP